MKISLPLLSNLWHPITKEDKTFLSTAVKLTATLFCYKTGWGWRQQLQQETDVSWERCEHDGFAIMSLCRCVCRHKSVCERELETHKELNFNAIFQSTLCTLCVSMYVMNTWLFILLQIEHNVLTPPHNVVLLTMLPSSFTHQAAELHLHLHVSVWGSALHHNLSFFSILLFNLCLINWKPTHF